MPNIKLTNICQQNLSCTKNWLEYVIIASIKIANVVISKVLFFTISFLSSFSVVFPCFYFFLAFSCKNWFFQLFFWLFCFFSCFFLKRKRRKDFFHFLRFWYFFSIFYFSFTCMLLFSTCIRFHFSASFFLFYSTFLLLRVHER